MAFAAGLIGDRWTLLVLRGVFYGVGRFSDLQSDLGISRAVLSDRLTRLVDLGLLQTQAYRRAGGRSWNAYKLTETGRQFLLPLMALATFGERVSGERSPLQMKDGNGEGVRVALVNASGQVVTQDDVVFELSEPDRNA